MKIWFTLLISLCVVVEAQARLKHFWDYEKLNDRAELIVIAIPTNVVETAELPIPTMVQGGGIPQTGGFRCTNNLSQAFAGDYIKSCKVTKVSGAGSFRLRVSERNKTLFSSHLVKTNNSIIYEIKQPCSATKSN